MLRTIVLQVFIGLSCCALAAAAELRGEGEWQSLSGDSIKGTWSASLEESAGEVAGRLTLNGSNVFTGGMVTGTMDGGGIVLGVMVESLKQATFQGKLDGESVAGEWQSEIAGDHGVWSGTLSKGTGDR